MHTVDIQDAQTSLAMLISRVEAGEEVLILRGTIPVARLARVRQPLTDRQPGRLAGKIRLDDSFFDPLPEQELFG